MHGWIRKTEQSEKNCEAQPASQRLNVDAYRVLHVPVAGSGGVNIGLAALLNSS
jgi:hypothetical protein